MFLSCGHKGEDSVYLIPKNFEGNLLIVFNQQQGVDTIYEQEARIYSFDTTGVLMTRFSPNSGIKQNHYYFIDGLGYRTDIKYALPSQLKGPMIS